MLSFYIGIIPWSSLNQYQSIKVSKRKKSKTNYITLYDEISINPLNNEEINLDGPVKSQASLIRPL